MKTFITLLFALISWGSYAQEGIKEQMPTAAQKFQADLKNHAVKLYTVGGLKPSNHKADTAFQERYMVDYHDFGCIAPPDMDYYAAYNLIVFKHLKEKWGKEWEKDIKENTIGFYNWTQVK